VTGVSASGSCTAGISDGIRGNVDGDGGAVGTSSGSGLRDRRNDGCPGRVSGAPVVAVAVSLPRPGSSGGRTGSTGKSVEGTARELPEPSLDGTGAAKGDRYTAPGDTAGRRDWAATCPFVAGRTGSSGDGATSSAGDGGKGSKGGEIVGKAGRTGRVDRSSMPARSVLVGAVTARRLCRPFRPSPLFSSPGGTAVPGHSAALSPPGQAGKNRTEASEATVTLRHRHMRFPFPPVAVIRAAASAAPASCGGSDAASGVVTAGSSSTSPRAVAAAVTTSRTAAICLAQSCARLTMLPSPSTSHEAR
jgi:hypothetical protein